MKQLAALGFGLLLTAVAFAQTTQTLNVPITVSVSAAGATTVTVPTESLTIPAPTVTPPVVTPPVVTPPVVTPPVSTASTSWVYHGGVFLWPGDWSGGAATLNYADTVGLPGAKDIAFKTNEAFGYWLPYPPTIASTQHPGFSTVGYTSLRISIKPTSSAQRYSMGAYKYTLINGQFQDDISTGAGVSDISTYCTPKVAAGVWSVCTIPLTAIQAANLTTFYKFIFQDQSGSAGLTTYINDVGFAP